VGIKDFIYLVCAGVKRQRTSFEGADESCPGTNNYIHETGLFGSYFEEDASCRATACHDRWTMQRDTQALRVVVYIKHILLFGIFGTGTYCSTQSHLIELSTDKKKIRA
jgi:hypothetical protein